MINIGGLQKSTLIDFPGRVAATIFLCSCNFRCPWCYSKELVLPSLIKKHPKISEEELFSFLKERKGLLEGVCLSVAGDEPTVIRNNKILNHLPIKRLWDDTKPINRRTNPIFHEYQKVNFECLTKDGFKKAKEIIRHKTDTLYKIVASPGNYNVKVTGGHSIFVLTKKGLKVKKATSIKKGDFLLSANVGLLNHNFILKTIDLIEYMPELLEQKQWIIEAAHIRNKFSNARIKIPKKIPITEQFCKFLGYAVAEGSAKYRYFKGEKKNLSGYQFSLGNELNLAKKILKLYRDIFKSKTGIIHKKRGASGSTQYDVLIGNFLIAKFINKLIGEGFRNKHISTIIFNTTPKNKIAFLKSLAEGDGYQRIVREKSQQEFSIRTASPCLAHDINFLANTLGVFSWIEREKKKPGHEESFRIVISVNSLGRLNLEKQIKTKYSFNTRVKGIPILLVNYALRGQKRIHPKRLDKWIDLSNISKEKKRAAVRFGFLTKTGKISEKTKIIQFLYDLIQKWDIKEVKSVKKIKLQSFQYVYDLVVPENHSFVGGSGSFLLHNTGGEPTIHKDLPKFIKKIRELDYVIKLDTNGSNPEALKKLLSDKLIDYVAMDIKLPKERYKKELGVDDSKIEKSINILKESGVKHEFRTTVVPTVHTKEAIIEIAKWIGPAKKYFLQNFRPEKTIDPKFEKIKPYPIEYLEEIREAAAPFFEKCEIR